MNLPGILLGRIIRNDNKICKETNMLSKIKQDAKNITKTFCYKINNKLLTLEDDEEACKKPELAKLFAKYIPGGKKVKCQEAACKDPEYAYWFARYIPGANIEKCQEAACKNPYWAYYFAMYIPGADVEKCRRVCEGTVYAF